MKREIVPSDDDPDDPDGGAPRPAVGPAEFDPVIHAQARLRLTAALADLPDGDQITFSRLQKLLGMTAGNLATHLRTLEDAGYAELTKSSRRRAPVTSVTLTRRGRSAFEGYVASLRPLLDGGRSGDRFLPG